MFGSLNRELGQIVFKEEKKSATQTLFPVRAIYARLTFSFSANCKHGADFKFVIVRTRVDIAAPLKGL